MLHRLKLPLTLDLGEPLHVYFCKSEAIPSLGPRSLSQQGIITRISVIDFRRADLQNLGEHRVGKWNNLAKAGLL